MGASCSIANDPVSIFPEELVLKILSSLAVSDLVSCRRINRRLNGIIDNSQHLQHHIDTAIAGVVDNPNSPLSLLERREALARRQVAWDTFQPQRVTSNLGRIDPLELDGNWLQIYPLREEDHHAIVQVAVCPDNNDLVAIGIRCGDVSYPLRSFNSHSIEIDVICLSGGGGEHPWTRKSTVRLEDILKENCVCRDMEIEIHTNLLAVLLRPEFAGMGWPEHELWVFDWKTGGEIACLKAQGIKSFRFLSNSVIVVVMVNFSESTAILKLFSLPVTNGNVRQTSVINVAALGLPFVDNGCRIARVDLYPSFVKKPVIRNNRVLYDTSINARPFVNSKSDNIIFVTLNIGSGYGYDNISFVIHSSTLLRHALPSHSHGNMQDPVPWELWGPPVTRWYEGGILVGGGPVTCGQRCLLRYPAGWELWDFNPCRVRRLGRGFAAASETAHLTVETEPSCAKSHGIKEGICSSLPFVKLVPKKWPIYIYTGLHEDRIIGQKYLERRYSVDNLYFG